MIKQPRMSASYSASCSPRSALSETRFRSALSAFGALALCWMGGTACSSAPSDAEISEVSEVSEISEVSEVSRATRSSEVAPVTSVAAVKADHARRSRDVSKTKRGKRLRGRGGSQRAEGAERGLKRASKRAHDVSPPARLTPADVPTLTSCPERYECSEWRLKPNAPQLCLFQVALYEQRRALVATSGVEERETRWALIGSRVSSTSQRAWSLIWEGVKRAEFVAGAHAERVISVATLSPLPSPLSETQPCHDFALRQHQRARSFNRVDAREREFDEEDVEEARFMFEVREDRYRERVVSAPPKIRVRAR